MGRRVTRREAAEELGYSYRSLTSLMNRDPARWPPPVGREPIPGGPGWRWLYDLDALREARGVTPRGTPKRRAGLTDDDGLVQCYICQRRMRALPRHVASRHGITMTEYRARYGIPETTPLVGEAAREAMTDSNRARDLTYLRPYQAAGQMDRVRPDAIQRHRETVSRRIVREHMAPAQRRGVAAMQAANRERLERLAREHGWESLRAAIRATRYLAVAEAARQIGVSKQTVRRRRKKWADSPD